MLQRFLFIALTLCSLSATAQWQQTGSKVRYVNGLGIPTKDTAAGVAADSSQIVIRPADSALYIKYKRTWVKVGGGTVSGTINRVPKFTGATALGNSSIDDSASAVTMTINPSGNIGINNTAPVYKIDITANSADQLRLNTPTGQRFTQLYFANNLTAKGSLWLDNTDSFFELYGYSGIGIKLSTNAIERMRITSGGAVLINPTVDNGVDKLQVSGSMNVSARATAQNLSVTNNISVTNDINQGSGTANTNYTILANGTSSGWAGRMVGEYATGQFNFQHRNNTPTFTTCFSLNANGGVGGTTFYDNAFIAGQGYLTVNTTANNGVDKLLVNGSTISTQYKLSALNTAPATASSTGTLGEIRIDANYIYICTATNTWKRVAIATW